MQDLDWCWSRSLGVGWGRGQDGNGVKAARDIVQFAQFNPVRGGDRGGGAWGGGLLFMESPPVLCLPLAEIEGYYPP